MKKAYFAISYSKRKKFNKEIEALQSLFDERGIELLVFVDKYNFAPNQEVLMMQTAFKEIDSSDILIAELTNLSVGVGIELGYALASKKPIVYLHNINSAYSPTAAGSADLSFNYDSVFEMQHKMLAALAKLL